MFSFADGAVELVHEEIVLIWHLNGGTSVSFSFCKVDVDVLFYVLSLFKMV